MSLTVVLVTTKLWNTHTEAYKKGLGGLIQSNPGKEKDTSYSGGD